MEVLNPLLSRRFPPPSRNPRIHQEQALQAGGHRFDPGTLHHPRSRCAGGIGLLAVVVALDARRHMDARSIVLWGTLYVIFVAYVVATK
jgi:hypothetical protein